MLSLAIVLIFITTNAQYNDICLWGVENTDVHKANGLYIYAGCVTGTDASSCSDTDRYYKLDRTTNAGSRAGCDDEAIYFVWRNSNKWILTGTEPGNTNRYFGTCSVVSNTVLDCVKNGGNWEIPAGNPQSNALLYDNFCPVKQCASITVSTNSDAGKCDANTFTQIGGNMFEYDNGSGKWVWWFNTLTFQWVCTRLKSDGTSYTDEVTQPTTPIGVCFPAVYLSQTTGGGIGDNERLLSAVTGFEGPFSPGQHADSGASGQVFSFTCNSGGTTTTKPPTTPLPTLGPGGDSPTYPTLAPTKAPKAADTPSDPASEPSGNPATPSDGPGGEPTKQPAGTVRIRSNWIALFIGLALCVSVLIV